MVAVVIRTKPIDDGDSFHAVFAEAFGFPDALVEDSAFVNWRRLQSGGPAVLALASYKH